MSETWQRVLDLAAFTPLEREALLREHDLRAPMAAARLGMGRTQFWKVVRLYGIPHVRHSPRCVTFRALDLEAYKRTRLVTCPAEARRLIDGRVGVLGVHAGARA